MEVKHRVGVQMSLHACAPAEIGVTCDVYMEQHTCLHLVSHLTPESYTWTRIHLPRPAESAREEMPGIAPSEALLPEARKHRINWDTSILGSQEVAGCLRYC